MVTNSTHAVAVEEAKFSAPEIKRGIWPFMVMAGLFRVMPKRAGLDFCMRGEAIDSKKGTIVHVYDGCQTGFLSKRYIVVLCV